ncbi:MAG: protein-methionine-sulfoxide reductase catalytic subunit MsrP [Anaerolineales bacterium]|nr:protein-methionine-sulfoxide reductase catalytic subunit MsrP [Anaerolineales bacterium]
MTNIHSSEITPEHLYLSRKKFIKGVGSAAASALILKACAPAAGENPELLPTGTSMPETIAANTPTLESELTTYSAVTNYNNYYEFSLDKQSVAKLAKDFRASPWQVEVGGLVNNPGIYDIDDLKQFTQEERIYRLRCVEAWSMVIPWQGFPLSALLKKVEPTAKAKYVRFETLMDENQMPGINRLKSYDWPYIEGLRLDEAMNDLTILATGIYGKPLLPQNGAPVRLVVPWKYGVKSVKSIVKIDLVKEMPTSFWMSASPNEYGFYANVNPDVDHPRWSQGTERLIGESGRRQTEFLNGYAGQVAHLYTGMDLVKWY